MRLHDPGDGYPGWMAEGQFVGLNFGFASCFSDVGKKETVDGLNVPDTY